MITNNPVVKDGKIYNQLGINLAVSPRWEPNRVGASVAVRLTPYKEDAEGVERLDEEVRAVVYGDAFIDAQNDPALAQCVATILSALQTFIDAKGL